MGRGAGRAGQASCPLGRNLSWPPLPLLPSLGSPLLPPPLSRVAPQCTLSLCPSPSAPLACVSRVVPEGRRGSHPLALPPACIPPPPPRYSSSVARQGLGRPLALPTACPSLLTLPAWACPCCTSRCPRVVPNGLRHPHPLRGRHHPPVRRGARARRVCGLFGWPRDHGRGGGQPVPAGPQVCCD